jgi:hypothetical protein
MPDARKSAGDEMKASRAEVEFQRVTGIANARRDRGELSAGAYAVILDRARKSRDAANDDPGAAQAQRRRRSGSRAPCAETLRH